MKVKLINYTPEPDVTCMHAACICRNTARSMGILERALEAGHDSLLEHASFMFEISDISRSLSHQLVRHRIASFAQQSQRCVALKQAALDWYTVPPKIAENKDAVNIFHTLMEADRQGYQALLNAGISKEDARYLLPNAANTKLMSTLNARSLHNFFALRCCKRAQWEIQDLANEMLRQVKLVAPVLFAKAGKQCASCKEPCHV